MVKYRVSLNYDQNHDRLGTQFELLGRYGNADSSIHDFIEQNNINYLDSYNFDQNDVSKRLISEIGYGFSTFDRLGSVIPYTGITLTNSSASEYQLGGILNLGSNLTLELVGKNSYYSNGTDNQSIELDGKISW